MRTMNGIKVFFVSPIRQAYAACARREMTVDDMKRYEKGNKKLREHRESGGKDGR